MVFKDHSCFSLSSRELYSHFVSQHSPRTRKCWHILFPSAEQNAACHLYHSPPAFVHWTAIAAAGLSEVLLLISIELFNLWGFNAQMRSMFSRVELQTGISFLRYSDPCSSFTEINARYKIKVGSSCWAKVLLHIQQIQVSLFLLVTLKHLFLIRLGRCWYKTLP